MQTRFPSRPTTMHHSCLDLTWTRHRIEMKSNWHKGNLEDIKRRNWWPQEVVLDAIMSRRFKINNPRTLKVQENHWTYDSSLSQFPLKSLLHQLDTLGFEIPLRCKCKGPVIQILYRSCRCGWWRIKAGTNPTWWIRRHTDSRGDVGNWRCFSSKWRNLLKLSRCKISGERVVVNLLWLSRARDSTKAVSMFLSNANGGYSET